MLKYYQFKREDRAAIKILVSISIIFYGLLLFVMYSTTQGDYTGHIAFAMLIESGEPITIPHILYHILIIALVKIFPFLGYIFASVIINLISCITLPILLYRIIRPFISSSFHNPSLITLVLVIGLLTVSHINIFSLQDKNIFIGYIPANLYHNPTLILLKPFAVLTFLYTLAVLQNNINFNIRTLILGNVLIILCMLAKPNYLISLFPALILCSVYFAVVSRPINWWLLITSIIVPISALLVIQYALAFGRTDAHIILAPLAWMRDTPLNLALKFILSTTFPLLVYGLYWPLSKKVFSLNFAWLSFIFGSAQIYLLMETGERMWHGNFQWSAQITLFILFMASLIFWIQQERHTWKWRVCTVFFILHAFSGVIFLILTIGSYL